LAASREQFGKNQLLGDELPRFFRRIEQQCLSWLFDEFGWKKYILITSGTQRNKPIHDFLSSIAAGPLTATLGFHGPPLLKKWSIFIPSDKGDRKWIISNIDWCAAFHLFFRR